MVFLCLPPYKAKPTFTATTLQADLARLYHRYPGGLPNRWTIIASELGRTEKDILAKVKLLKAGIRKVPQARLPAGTTQVPKIWETRPDVATTESKPTSSTPAVERWAGLQTLHDRVFNGATTYMLWLQGKEIPSCLTRLTHFQLDCE
jgi:hypothetical protein